MNSKIIEHYHNYLLAKELNQKPTIDISLLDKYAFQEVCYYGNIEMAKWILEINPNINVVKNSKFIFQHSCYNNYYDMIQWILKINPKLIHTKLYKYLFKYCWDKERINIAKLLLQYNPEMENLINFKDELNDACVNNNYPRINWILQYIKDFNIKKNDIETLYDTTLQLLQKIKLLEDNKINKKYGKL